MLISGDRAHTTCPVCGAVNPVVFMVLDHVWQSAGLPLGPYHRGGAGYWCLACFETKLGRAVVQSDLQIGTFTCNRNLVIIRD